MSSTPACQRCWIEDRKFVTPVTKLDGEPVCKRHYEEDTGESWAPSTKTNAGDPGGKEGENPQPKKAEEPLKPSGPAETTAHESKPAIFSNATSNAKQESDMPKDQNWRFSEGKKCSECAAPLANFNNSGRCSKHSYVKKGGSEAPPPNTRTATASRRVKATGTATARSS